MQEDQNPPPNELEMKVGADETANVNIDGTAAEPADTMPSLEESLRAAELLAAEHHDAWLRAKAETENLRRRAQEDVSKAHKFAAEKIASELLAVKDSLEAALAVQEQTVEALKAGVELTLKQLATAFEKSSVKELNPLGEKFDPHYHQAIAMVDAEQEANTVVSVLQKGYALHDRILRPALVTVAKPKSTA
jgi:molecular chaperone GrpE